MDALSLFVKMRKSKYFRGVKATMTADGDFLVVFTVSSTAAQVCSCLHHTRRDTCVVTGPSPSAIRGPTSEPALLRTGCSRYTLFPQSTTVERAQVTILVWREPVGVADLVAEAGHRKPQVILTHSSGGAGAGCHLSLFALHSYLHTCSV